MTLAEPSKALPSNSPAPKISAPEIEVPRKLRTGRASSSAAKASALSALSITCQGTMRFLAHRARPFEIGERDAAIQAGAHGVDEIGMAQRGDIAGALQRELLRVHRARDVDRQHQLDDRPVSAAGSCPHLCSLGRHQMSKGQSRDADDRFHDKPRQIRSISQVLADDRGELRTRTSRVRGSRPAPARAAPVTAPCGDSTGTKTRREARCGTGRPW